MENRFPAEYFENEVREGFFVPSMMKRAWAQELTVLGEIDRICSKYNIQYFAEWGTLLGAVRHAGFIPWDDDIDISMKRKDYEKFLEVADVELPREYKINNLRNKKDFCLFLARVMNTSHISFDDDYLREHNEFPYIAGVDIFVMDWVSSDADAEKRRDTVADYAITLADCIYSREMQFSQVMDGIQKLKNITGHSFGCDRERIRLWIDGENAGEIEEYITDVRQSMYMYAEKLFDSFTESESNELTQLFPFGLRNRHYRYPKEYYADAVRVPFEDTTIPVPLGYDKLLRMRYGDYMVVKKNRGGHGYPFYESQQEQLDKLAGVSLPRYEYTNIEKDYIIKNHEFRENNLIKKIADEEIEKMTEFSLPDVAQKAAIILGMAIEECYGNSCPAVLMLEEYCEQLYLFTQNEINENELRALCVEIKEKIQKFILDIEKIVFIVSRIDEWKYLEEIYKKEKLLNSYISIVVVPYYYKRFDNTLGERVYELDEFRKCIDESDNVKIFEYKDYNVELQQPDKVYIQNPYDEWDKAISIHPKYYTSNILKNCRTLIYIPPFVLDEFTKDNYCEYHNMSCYAIMPGVVRADKVVLQSEVMRRNYIAKLTEWAGEDTYELWKDKFITYDKAGISVKKQNMASEILSKVIPEDWKTRVYNVDGNRKHIILYHNELDFFVENKQKAITKINSVFDLLHNNAENILLIWNVREENDAVIHKTIPELEEAYKELKLRASVIGICDISDGKTALDISDAYYGDKCNLSRLCQMNNKPYMIENVDIK